MKREVLRTQVETCVQEANNDVAEGLQIFHRRMDDVIENEGITLEHVSIKNLFEAMVDRDRNIDVHNSVSVAESMYAAGMPTLVGKLLHPVFIKAYEPMTKEVLKLVEEVPTSKGEENIGGLSAHDMPQLTREGSPYQASQMTEKEAKIRNHKFGITIDLTAEAVREDHTGQIVSRARGIGLKGGTQIHAYIIQKVCDIPCTVTGEAAEYSLIINGTARAMYANDHSAWDNGQTNDNLGADVLGDTGLTNARTALAKLKDEKDDPIVMIPRFLIVPEALWKIAKSLLGSMNIVGSANNDVNVWKAAYELISSPFLDAVTTQAWWVGDSSLQSRIQWYWKPKTDTLGGNTQAAFDRDIVAQYKFSYKAGVGSTDYRFMYKGNTLT